VLDNTFIQSNKLVSRLHHILYFDHLLHQ